jgi:hypothetical protein
MKGSLDRSPLWDIYLSIEASGSAGRRACDILRDTRGEIGERSMFRYLGKLLADGKIYKDRGIYHPTAKIVSRPESVRLTEMSDILTKESVTLTEVSVPAPVNMLTVINLWTIVRKVPAIISIAKMIIDVLGSDGAKALFEAIRDAMQKFSYGEKADTLPQPERKRLVDRIKLRVGQRLLRLDDSQFAHTMHAFGRAEDAAIACATKESNINYSGLGSSITERKDA